MTGARRRVTRELGTTSLTIAALVTPPVTYAINRLLIF